MQLEIGMSTMRYLPASGTAGLARSFVSGNNRVPCPPPMMTDSTLLVLTDGRPVRDIKRYLSPSKLGGSYTRACDRASGNIQGSSEFQVPKDREERGWLRLELGTWNLELPSL